MTHIYIPKWKCILSELKRTYLPYLFYLNLDLILRVADVNKLIGRNISKMSPINNHFLIPNDILVSFLNSNPPTTKKKFQSSININNKSRSYSLLRTFPLSPVLNSTNTRRSCVLFGISFKLTTLITLIV